MPYVTLLCRPDTAYMAKAIKGVFKQEVNKLAVIYRSIHIWERSGQKTAKKGHFSAIYFFSNSFPGFHGNFFGYKMVAMCL